MTERSKHTVCRAAIGWAAVISAFLITAIAALVASPIFLLGLAMSATTGARHD